MLEANDEDHAPNNEYQLALSSFACCRAVIGPNACTRVCVTDRLLVCGGGGGGGCWWLRGCGWTFAEKQHTGGSVCSLLFGSIS